MIDYNKINADFNNLSSPAVYDNAQGNASSTQNKTSIYLFEGEQCLARMCNISLTNIDGYAGAEVIPDNVDDFAVWGNEVIFMLADHKGKKLTLRMNKNAYRQFLTWWYEQKEIKKPEPFESFAGADIIIDDRISSKQATVI